MAEPVGPEQIDVSVVVPTRNEAPNIDVLVDRLARALPAETSWELIFVDDSDDGTPDAIRTQIAAGHPVHLHHRRPGGRPGGLGGAVQDGFSMARGRIVAVMDADLQHPPEVIPRLLAPIVAGDADLVSGSRYTDRGERGGLSGPWRLAVASGSRWLVHAVIPSSRALTDPMSGLFAFEHERIAGLDLQANGFKILLEVVARGDWERVANVGYRFERRHAGRSKATLREGWLFAQHLVALARTTRPRPAGVSARTDPRVARRL